MGEEPCAKLLREQRERIVNDLEHVEVIVEKLSQNQLLTKIDAEDILCEWKQRRYRGIQALVNKLHFQGREEARRNFIALLQRTDQSNLCPITDQNIKQDVERLANSMGDVLPKEVYKTQLQAHAATIVKDTRKREQLLFDNKIDISQHQPVILNLGRQIPKEVKRDNLYEFHARDHHEAAVNISNALTEEKGNNLPRTALLIGPPGGGKTSLCMQILSMYSVNKWEGHDFIFHIPLKTIGNICPMSAVDFMIGRHGPPTTDRIKTWEIIENHEQRVLVVLDGLDEVNADLREDMGYTSDTTVHTEATTIINSLIEGRLLPKCQLLITTRPYKMDVLTFNIDRVLELAGLEVASIEALINMALEHDSDKAKHLTNYIRTHKEMETFYRLPINIQILISIFKSNVSRGAGSRELHMLPKRKTALHMLSLGQFMKQSMRGANQQTAAVTGVWDNEECVATFRKVVDLAGHAMRSYDGRQIMFEESDLRKVGLSDDEARRCGFLIATEQEANQPGMRARIMYMFGHLLQLEICASLHHVNRSVTDIMKLIGHGSGHMDAVCIFIVGLLGDPRCREILSSLYVGTTEGDWRRKLRDIMEELSSSKRIASTSGKFMLLEAYYESQGNDPNKMSSALRQGNQWNALDLSGLRSYHIRSLLHFLRHLQGRSLDTEPGVEPDRPGAIVTALDTPLAAVKLDFSDEDAANDCLRELSNMKSVKCVIGPTQVYHSMPHMMSSLFGHLVLVDFNGDFILDIEPLCDGLANQVCSVQGMRVVCSQDNAVRLIATRNSSLKVLVVQRFAREAEESERRRERRRLARLELEEEEDAKKLRELELELEEEEEEDQQELKLRELERLRLWEAEKLREKLQELELRAWRELLKQRLEALKAPELRLREQEARAEKRRLREEEQQQEAARQGRLEEYIAAVAARERAEREYGQEVLGLRARAQINIRKVGLRSLEYLHMSSGFILSGDTEQTLASHSRLKRVSEDQCMEEMDITYRAMSKSNEDERNKQEKQSDKRGKKVV